jgi:uncharacterized protein (TIGR03084 family)
LILFRRRDTLGGMEIAVVLDDLAAESEELDRLVAVLPVSEWSRPTPAPGWSIAHQIAHLAWTDQTAELAATDRDGFAAHLREAAADLGGFVDRAAQEGAALPQTELLAEWRTGRERLARALRAVPEGAKLPWYGPPLRASTLATARIMETWAHGQDVADALDVRRRPTARLRHVAHLAVRTRDFAYVVNGRTPPATAFRVELSAPGGRDTWSWGPDDADQRVTGPALDFCLLAVQRRHRDDLAVTAHGRDADTWLDIIQAFAGPPGPGRHPGQFKGVAG